MNLTQKLAEGKTKVVYAHPDDPSLAVLQHKDGITAGDGARRNTIAGKGALAGRTTANVFRLLTEAGIATHFIDAPELTLTVVRRCTMLPLEVVMRRRATGSYLKRHPNIAEGMHFDPTLVEFFLKDDARHDPQISEDEIISTGIASDDEVQEMQQLGREVFLTLERAWTAQGVTLVDLKIEFGRPVETGDEIQETGDEVLTPSVSRLTSRVSRLFVADVIDNDSWRIWPGGEKGRMLDKQVYRNAQAVDDAVLDDVRQRYETVAEMTEQF